MQNKKNLLNSNLNIIKKLILNNFKHNNNYVGGDNNKNTVLLIEPRFIQHTLLLLANAYNKLGDNWNYVFYCGKSFKNTWKRVLPNFIELRELEHDNFQNINLYSDFCKSKELWESLYGDYVLTIQLDSWIMSIEPYTIDFFINLKQSYIGGNVHVIWSYFAKTNYFEKNKVYHKNFNGGLSLRNRNDMIIIINLFPPLKTTDDQSNCNFLSEPEDVYFLTGCMELGFPVGDSEECAHFSLQEIYYDKYFGIHQPNNCVSTNINKTHKYLKFLNVNLKLLK